MFVSVIEPNLIPETWKEIKKKSLLDSLQLDWLSLYISETNRKEMKNICH